MSLSKDNMELQNALALIRKDIDEELVRDEKGFFNKEKLESFYKNASVRLDILMAALEKVLRENEQLSHRQGWTCVSCGTRNVRIVCEPKVSDLLVPGSP